MYRVRPKKNLGQHFLTDMSVAQRIADTIDSYPDIPVLEVGPGMGALTQFLLPKQRPLKVVEIDRESISYLHEHMPAIRDGIVEGNFLKMDLENIFDGRPFVLTGKYPYNISNQIFFRLLEYRHLIPCCTGMIQKEVAERLTSGPGSKEYGILSVFLSVWYDTEYLFTVPETVFSPPPKVKSAVVRFTRNKVTDMGCDEKLFMRLVKVVFNQRRKMMRGSIKPLLAQLDAEKNTIDTDHSAFLQTDILTRRPEQLSVEDFIHLTNQVAALYS